MQDSNRQLIHAFTLFANRVAALAGHYMTTILAMLLVLAWGIAGPVVDFSDTWLLLAGTATSIVAFLMVFLIQHTQNRDAAAVHLKLNELLRAVESANPALIRVEDDPNEELEELKRLYIGLCDERDTLKARLQQEASRR